MIDYENIPGLTMDSLERWEQHGIYPGGFLCAVLENDLQGAFAKADTGNLNALHAIVKYVYNRMDARCWGSREKMTAWADRHHELRNSA